MSQCDSTPEMRTWQKRLSESLPWQSPRLLLSLATVDDAHFLYGMFTRKEGREFLGGPLVTSLERIRQSIVFGEGWMDSCYIAMEVHTNVAIGYAGILENARIGSEENDFLVAVSPEYEGQHYGREILSTVRDNWLRCSNRTHCTASANHLNPSSIAILSNCGFVQIGEYSDHLGELRYTYRYDKEAAT